MFNKEGNEPDVREDFAVPFLANLGYRRGTSNNIDRELLLRYDRDYLGRKKPDDPKLIGRADYVLSVLGHGRWVLEVKGPNKELTLDDVEQAITYARHPEVSGYYIVLTNGQEIRVYRHVQRANEDPLVRLEIKSGEETAKKLEALLSPQAIMRDCSPPIVDLKEPLLDGFRSTARIRSGMIHYRGHSWTSPTPMDAMVKAQLEESFRRLDGLQSHITGGSIWRDDGSRIRAKLRWQMPHEMMQAFMLEKGLEEYEYVSLSQRISADPEHPTLFDFVAECRINEGEQVFDLMEWRSLTNPLPTSVRYQGQAVGFVADNVFSGVFDTTYVTTIDQIPNLGKMIVNLRTQGNFELTIDPG